MNPPLNNDDELLTIPEVMEILKLNEQTIKRHIKKQLYDAFKIGGVYRISKKSLFEYIENSQV